MAATRLDNNASPGRDFCVLRLQPQLEHSEGSPMQLVEIQAVVSFGKPKSASFTLRLLRTSWR